MSGQPSDPEHTCSQCFSTLPSRAPFCGVCGHAITTRRSVPQGSARTTVTGPTARPPFANGTGAAGVQPAGRGVRTASSLLDLAAMISPALPLSIVGAVIGVPEVVYIVIPVAFAAVWLWMQIWQGLTGKTFGKAMLGLRIVREADHRPPGVSPSVMRSLIFVGTAGFAALPVVLGAIPQPGLHDRLSGLQVIDTTIGDNPLGPRQQQNTLRRASGRSLNRVHSPVPASAPRRG